ncbi:MAG: hypothetical protein WA110_01150 [Anaerolineaceae bacterium]
MGTFPLCRYWAFNDLIEDGQFIEPNFATAIPSIGLIRFKIVREGNVYAARYSENGTVWGLLGAHEPGFTPKSVGLLAHK